MIHVLIGDGKGKTTSAVGMAVRALGHGWSVSVFQFLKDGRSGEVAFLKDIKNVNCFAIRMPTLFISEMCESEVLSVKKECEELLALADQSKSQMVILDEVLHALDSNMISKDQLLTIFRKDAELVLTGRTAPDWLIEIADYVSVISNRKHPFEKGIISRQGIEY